MRAALQMQYHHLAEWGWGVGKLSLFRIGVPLILLIALLIVLLVILVIVFVLFNLLNKARRRSTEMERLVAGSQLAQQELQRSEHAAKEFVSNVSHDVNSALASLQSFADMLQQPNVEEQQRVHYAQIISEEASQLSAFSNQLLLLSRLENGREVIAKQMYPIRVQLRQVLQLAQYKLSDKQLMTILKASEQSLIYADQVLMLQVWSNLLENAIKHTPSGGTITLEVSCSTEQCNVAISNMGEGIDEQTLPHIFERFYSGEHREAASGNGLGLSIVKKIIELHDGTVYLSSEKDQGTQAVVCLQMPAEYDLLNDYPQHNHEA